MTIPDQWKSFEDYPECPLQASLETRRFIGAINSVILHHVVRNRPKIDHGKAGCQAIVRIDPDQSIFPVDLIVSLLPFASDP
jgi:hypothetical protein